MVQSIHYQDRRYYSPLLKRRSRILSFQPSAVSQMPKDEGLAEQKKRLSMDLATLLYASVNATDRRVSKRSRRLIASE